MTRGQARQVTCKGNAAQFPDAQVCLQHHHVSSQGHHVSPQDHHASLQDHYVCFPRCWGGRLGRWGGRPGRWGGRLGWLEGGLVRWGSWSGEQLFWPEHRSCVMVAGGSVERASRRLAMEGTPRPFPEGGIFRPMRSGGDQGTVSPRSIQTLTSARSAGVTPWIRPAWPRLWGRMLASLIWASRLRPGILEKSSHAGT